MKKSTSSPSSSKRKIEFNAIPATMKNRRKAVREDDDSDFEDFDIPPKKMDRPVSYAGLPKKDWDYYIQPSDRFPVKVTHHSGEKVISNIKRTLTPETLAKFSSTCFGKFIEMQDVKFQYQLIHALLLREVKQPVFYELWLKVSGKLLKFSIDEFSLITGLKCCGNADKKPFLNSDSDFKANCFGNVEKVTKKWVEDCFLQKRWSNEDEALKLALLYFVEIFLYNNKPCSYVRDEHINMIGNGEFENFPWGKDVFQRTIEFLKSKLASVKGCDFLKKNPNIGIPPTQVRYDGFPLAFQTWFLECCPAANGILGSSSGEAIPRILRWTVPLARDREYLTRNIFNQSAEDLKLCNLKPTEEERSVLVLDAMFLKGKRKVVFEETTHVGHRDSKLNGKIRKMYSEFSLFKSYVELQFAEVLSVLSELKSVLSLNDHRAHVTEDMPENVSAAKATQSMPKNSNDGADDAVERHTADNESAPPILDQIQNDGNDVDKEPEDDFNCATETVGHEEEINKVSDENVQTPVHYFEDIDPSALHKAVDKVEREYEKARVGEEAAAVCNVVMDIPFTKRKGFHPLDDNLGIPTTFPDQIDFLCWIEAGIRQNRVRDVYTPKDNILPQALNFEVASISDKKWFYSMVYGGKFLDDSHIDIVMYYIRKKAKYNPHNGMRITTTDCLFDNRLMGLFKLYLKNKGDVTTIQDINIVTDYVQGHGMLCNTHWKDVDEVLFPMHLGKKKHWILGRLVFKDRRIYIYNSLKSPTARFDA
ncbi:uncharacterized protein LOC126682780 [Mercurialis annua]|uniref:uncharacterized protein LOC126682780 n=1 Tax=Mercurialis annua TaxID=3986 RepID=UPI00215ED6C5|nr:uncharacterized protein LOC126682780 [Mercurialis annua]